ncbi:hypothetical protein IE53DRAFT_364267 [Violaceomyces palustris]|uniref:Uncharacterized protein n=1 Tax=Violaceomyces palustris TaxID=1673888 RepID=A0ACD0NQ73_9BASI|nr:hypothetical protein IE53DRAFT_364267 [Violaceomyces palustris]
MSRHRAVRNLDLEEELAEDDYYSDEDPYENITTDEQESLAEALSLALELLGPSESSGISEREIKDALWDSYFDVDTAVGHLVEEKSRREAKAERERQKAAMIGRSRPDIAGPSMRNPDKPQGASIGICSSNATLLAASRPSIGRGSWSGRARGVAGLGRGGRAGLAKRNLAAIAPGGLPAAEPSRLNQPTKLKLSDSAFSRSSHSSGKATTGSKLSSLLETQRLNKRPAETESQPSHPSSVGIVASAITSSTGRPSKLAALAAARSGSSSPRSSPVNPSMLSIDQSRSCSSASESSSTAKPLSKLQQRMQANLAAKQELKKTTSGENDTRVGSDAMDEDERSQREEIVSTCYGSDLPVALLFPHATISPESGQEAGVDDVDARSSLFSTPSLRDSGPPLSASVPGGTPFAAFIGQPAGNDLNQDQTWMEALRTAFSGPSPDDIVMRAREGTNLAAKTVLPARSAAAK